MSYLRIFVPAVALIGIVAWTLATGQQPGTDKSGPKVTPVDLRAQKALADALDALDRKKLPWIETTVWQQLEAEGLRFQAQGVYLAGPDHQLHLLLKVDAGDAAGRLEVVCDGKTYWETFQVGDGELRVHKMDFQRILAVLNEPALPGEARTRFLHGQFFAGVVPLLQSLQKNMTFTHSDSITWKGRKVLRISGGWKPDLVKAIQAQSPKRWPEYTPRECRVYLDGSTHWPYRLEWWGPAPRQRHALLFEMEFRNPRFEPMSPERVAKVFHFQPDPGQKVPDHTRQVIDTLRQNPKR